MRICHMTSVHASTDTRIFIKECTSLADKGHEVFLVAKGESRTENGVKVIGVGNSPSSRLKRILCFRKKIYKTAKRLNCDVYHFHDPELLPYGLKLKKSGKKVIFDSHEDVAGQIEDKFYIPTAFRKLISRLYHCYETYVTKKLDAVVVATEHIGSLFKGRARKIVVINNYPILSDISCCGRPFEERKPIICYAGGISENRGIKVMIEAMKGIDATLILAGPCDKPIQSYIESDVRAKFESVQDVDSLLSKKSGGGCTI